MSPVLGSRIKQWWLPALLVAGLVLFFAIGGHRAISWQTIALHYGQITAYTEANLALADVNFIKGRPPLDLWAEIYYQRELEWRVKWAQCAVSEQPFWQHPRRSATPPNPF